MSKKKTAKIDGKKLDHRKLALGEATGHYHLAESESSTLWDVGGGVLVLDAPEGTAVTHQEHKPISLPPGQYERRITLEWDHFAEEAREVQD